MESTFRLRQLIEALPDFFLVKSSIVAAAVFGVITTNFQATEWMIPQLALFLLPLLAVVFPSENRLILAFWLSIFLVLQALLSPVLIDRSYITLQPNFREVVNVEDGFPGISGPQLITTDSKGFRTTKTIDYASDESFRIFAIGGSTTEQIYIDDQDTWTSILEKSLDRKFADNVEVINTGVSGLGADHHLATLRHIIPYHPKLAIILVGINDWNDQIIGHFTAAASRPTLLDWIGQFRDGYELKNSLLGNAIVAAGGTLQRLAGYGGAQTHRDDNGEWYTIRRGSLQRAKKHSFDPEEVPRHYEAVMQKISDTCKRYAINCMFVTQPTGYQASASEEFKKGFWMTPPDKDYTLDFESMRRIASLYNDYLRDFARRHGHYLCDAAEKIPPSYENFYDECHFNIAGAKRMGSVVTQCIEESGIK